MPPVVLSNLGKQFGRGHPAVDGIDLDLPDGSFTAILGPSGCGKTTTLRMLAGLEHPTAGAIQVGEQVFSSVEAGIFLPPNRRNLGLVFQNYALWPHLSVTKNIEFGLKIKRLSRDERQRRVSEVLELLHVGHLADRIPAQLSGGEQQRVAIARALAPRPSLMLFDEPLSNLDAPLRLELSTELKRLHHELGMTAVLVTHDQAEAMAVATQLVVIRAGTIEQIGPPAAVYRSPASVHVARFLGSPPMNLFQPRGSFEGLTASTTLQHHLPEAAIDLLGVRPEHVHINDGRAGWRTHGTIQSVMASGPAAIVRVVLPDDTVIAAVVSGETLLVPGQEIDVVIDPHRVHAFGPEGGRIDSRSESEPAFDLPSTLTDGVSA